MLQFAGIGVLFLLGVGYLLAMRRRALQIVAPWDRPSAR